MKLKVLNRIRGGGEIAAEVPATLAGYKRWISLSYLDPNTPGLNSEQQNKPYLLLSFEVNERHLLDTNDVWEETMENQNRQQFVSLEEALDALRDMVKDTDIFETPWDVESYPL